MQLQYNIEAEKSLLGAILIDDKCYHSIISDGLEEEDFYSTQNGKIYRIFSEMVGRCEKIDILTAGEKCGDTVYLANLINTFPTIQNVKKYAEIIKEKSNLRKIIRLGAEISAMAANAIPSSDIIAEANRKLISTRRSEKTVSDSKDLVNLFIEAEAESQNKVGLLGMKSGFSFLDEIIDGIRPGHLWVIGGATSVGKSYFAINIIKSLIEQKKRAIFYSLEMSKLDLTQRLIGLIADVNGTMALKGFLKQEGKERVEDAKQIVYDSRFSIYKGDSSWNSLKLSMLEQHAKEPVDCFFIDYLQQIQSKERTMYDTLRLVSSELQNLAQSINVPIIAFSQLNNDSIKNQSDAIGYKGSGDIANSADLGLELRLDEDDKEAMKRKQASGEPYKVKLVVRKSRHGKMGTQDLLFENRIGKFYEV